MLKRIKVFIIIFVCIALILIPLMSFKLFIPLYKYNKAQEAVKKCQYIEAYNIFCELGDFKDSKNMLDKIYIPYTKSVIASTEIGKTFKLGNLHDNDINWIVLKKANNKVLAITKECVESRKYHKDLLETTYAESIICDWVSLSFLVEAFDSEDFSILADEKECKIINNVKNKFGINCGIDINNNAFLLSTDEAEQYFKNDKDRVAYFPNGDKAAWWLRTTGDSVMRAAIVGVDGDIYYEGITNTSEVGVRPAVWFDTTI